MHEYTIEGHRISVFEMREISHVLLSFTGTVIASDEYQVEQIKKLMGPKLESWEHIQVINCYPQAIGPAKSRAKVQEEPQGGLRLTIEFKPEYQDCHQ